MFNIINHKLLLVFAHLTTLFYLSVCEAKSISVEKHDINVESFQNAFQSDRQIYSTIEERMALHRVPGMSITVIKDSQILWSKGYGVIQAGTDEKVDPHTIFSVGSISKVATAVTTLKLVENGKLTLNQDINTYLRRWQYKSNPFTRNQPVTLRQILSHTSGFNVHGFKDFQPGEVLPTLLDILNGRPPAKNIPVQVVFIPGTQQRYSGGGVMVEQLIIEDVTVLSFAAAAQSMVLEPLRMNRTTFTNPIPSSYGNIAKAHNANGQPVALPRGWESMPEAAASGLWTTSHDLALLMIALIDAYRGENPLFLNQNTAHDMMTPVKPSQYGLGLQIPKPGLFSHGGANESYKAYMIGSLETGNGIVVLTNGSNGDDIGAEVIDVMTRLEAW